MTVGRGEQEMHGQTGAATQQGMHPIAVQEGTGMVGGSMTSGGIGISSAPSQDRSAINDEITSSDQTAAHGTPDREHKEGLKGWGTCRRPSLTQLGRTGNAWRSIGSLWQAAGHCQGRPTHQPVMHVLVGEPKDGFSVRRSAARTLRGRCVALHLVLWVMALDSADVPAERPSGTRPAGARSQSS